MAGGHARRHLLIRMGEAQYSRISEALADYLERQRQATSPEPQHTDIAGLPVTLNGIVRLGRSRVANLEPASIGGASPGTAAVIT